MMLPVAQDPRKLRKDLRTLAVFVENYCWSKHGGAPRVPFSIKTHDIIEIRGRGVDLCSDCCKLLAHAFVKRTCCPMSPKPWCKHCPKHCYHPLYRQKMREVMRSSGMNLLLRGRLDYLLHFLF
jgi:hypothetical protein